MLMTLLVLAQSGSVPVTDEAPHPVLDRIAETIVAVAARDGDPVPESWFVAGQRARAVRWHLAEPDDGDGWYRRTGWISQDGLQAGVAACGGENGVAMLGFQVSGESAAPLLSALSAHGDLRREVDHDEELFWFEPDGYAPAMITASALCTPEGAAVARSCRTDIQVTYALDFRSEACTAP